MIMDGRCIICISSTFQPLIGVTGGVFLVVVTLSFCSLYSNTDVSCISITPIMYMSHAGMLYFKEAAEDFVTMSDMVTLYYLLHMKY